ncbi:MAG: hypothetical protein ABDH20_00835 [Thermus sp.]
MRHPLEAEEAVKARVEALRAEGERERLLRLGQVPWRRRLALYLRRLAARLEGEAQGFPLGMGCGG